jgi:hypothetical protein
LPRKLKAGSCAAGYCRVVPPAAAKSPCGVRWFAFDCWSSLWPQRFNCSSNCCCFFCGWVRRDAVLHCRPTAACCRACGVATLRASTSTFRIRR